MMETVMSIFHRVQRQLEEQTIFLKSPIPTQDQSPGENERNYLDKKIPSFYLLLIDLQKQEEYECFCEHMNAEGAKDKLLDALEQMIGSYSQSRDEETGLKFFQNLPIICKFFILDHKWTEEFVFDYLLGYIIRMLEYTNESILNQIAFNIISSFTQINDPDLQKLNSKVINSEDNIDNESDGNRIGQLSSNVKRIEQFVNAIIGSGEKNQEYAYKVYFYLIPHIQEILNIEQWKHIWSVIYQLFLKKPEQQNQNDLKQYYYQRIALTGMVISISDLNINEISKELIEFIPDLVNNSILLYNLKEYPLLQNSSEDDDIYKYQIIPLDNNSSNSLMKGVVQGAQQLMQISDLDNASKEQLNILLIDILHNTNNIQQINIISEILSSVNLLQLYDQFASRNNMKHYYTSTISSIYLNKFMSAFQEVLADEEEIIGIFNLFKQKIESYISVQLQQSQNIAIAASTLFNLFLFHRHKVFILQQIINCLHLNPQKENSSSSAKLLNNSIAKNNKLSSIEQLRDIILKESLAHNQQQQQQIRKNLDIDIDKMQYILRSIIESLNQGERYQLFNYLLIWSRYKHIQWRRRLLIAHTLDLIISQLPLNVLFSEFIREYFDLLIDDIDSIRQVTASHAGYFSSKLPSRSPQTNVYYQQFLGYMKSLSQSKCSNHKIIFIKICHSIHLHTPKIFSSYFKSNLISLATTDKSISVRIAAANIISKILQKQASNYIKKQQHIQQTIAKQQQKQSPQQVQQSSKSLSCFSTSDQYDENNVDILKICKEYSYKRDMYVDIDLINAISQLQNDKSVDVKYIALQLDELVKQQQQQQQNEREKDEKQQKQQTYDIYESHNSMNNSDKEIIKMDLINIENDHQPLHNNNSPTITYLAGKTNNNNINNSYGQIYDLLSLESEQQVQQANENNKKREAFEQDNKEQYGEYQSSGYIHDTNSAIGLKEEEVGEYPKEQIIYPQLEEAKEPHSNAIETKKKIDSINSSPKLKQLSSKTPIDLLDDLMQNV